jgi:hypothetical protein
MGNLQEEYGTTVFLKFSGIWAMLKGWHGWIYDHLMGIWNKNCRNLSLDGGVLDFIIIGITKKRKKEYSWNILEFEYLENQMYFWAECQNYF